MKSMSFPRALTLNRRTTEHPPEEFAAVSEAFACISVEDLRLIAQNVGLEAAALITRMRSHSVDAAGRVRVADVKTSAVDPVTAVDKACEQLIRQRLNEATPGARILGEEEGTGTESSQPEDFQSTIATERCTSGASGVKHVPGARQVIGGEKTPRLVTDRHASPAVKRPRAEGLLWVVDPIDGTVNYVYGIPAYCVSIAATVAGIPIAAAVVDVAHGIVFSAACGGPCFEQSYDAPGDGSPGRIYPGRVLSLLDSVACEASQGTESFEGSQECEEQAGYGGSGKQVHGIALPSLHAPHNDAHTSSEAERSNAAELYTPVVLDNAAGYGNYTEPSTEDKPGNEPEYALRDSEIGTEASMQPNHEVGVQALTKPEHSEDATGMVALQTALVATGFSYLSQRRRAQAQLLVDLLPQVRDIRRIGSAALDLCHVAAGRVDAYFEHGLGPWDYAAGVLIAARAGAEVKMPPLDVYSDEGAQVSAAKPGIAAALEELLDGLVAGGVLHRV